MSFYSSLLLLIVSAFTFAGCNYPGDTGQNVLAANRLLVEESPLSAVKGETTAVFAGGCFWGVEAVFEHVKGVTDVRSGYAGGDARTANYENVGTGGSGHAEAVLVTYDPSQITYERLLFVFFSVAHDPTQLNRQGPDVGPEYRSAIFYSDATQKKLAEDFIAALDRSKSLPKPVVTKVVPLEKFYDAEEYHQDYLRHHLTDPYIVAHDLPKLKDLKTRFPDLYLKK